MPLERGYDFQADYEWEQQFLTDGRAAITPFNSLTDQEREQYSTFEEQPKEKGQTYTPTLYNRLRAATEPSKRLSCAPGTPMSSCGCSKRRAIC